MTHEQHESRSREATAPPTQPAYKEGVADIGMGCFEPLGLAVSIHEDLPFLTDLGNSYKLLSNTTFASVINEGVGEAIDYFLVSTMYLPLKILVMECPFEACRVAWALLIIIQTYNNIHRNLVMEKDQPQSHFVVDTINDHHCGTYLCILTGG